MLDKITGYLRVVHLYCIWCGTTYNGKYHNSLAPWHVFVISYTFYIQVKQFLFESQ